MLYISPPQSTDGDGVVSSAHSLPLHSHTNFVTFYVSERKSMKPYVFLVLFLALSFASQAQTDIFRLSIKDRSAEDMYSIRRNAVYSDLLAFYNYEYLAPLNYRLGLSTKLGILNGDKLMVVAETGLLAPGPRHFAEFGIGALINTHTDGYQFIFDSSILSSLEDDFYFTLRAGYRYQAPGGFLFKAGGLYSPGNFFIPLIGMGFVF